jgi:hypothetical protein
MKLQISCCVYLQAAAQTTIYTQPNFAEPDPRIETLKFLLRYVV